MSTDNRPSLVVDRDALFLRLKELAPPLADVYQVARQLVTLPSMQGKAYFLAHAAREIANGLPEWITGIAADKESKQLNRLAERWDRAFPPSKVPLESGASPPSIQDVLVPRDLFEDVTKVLRGRQSRTASRDAVQRLFTWLGPGNRYLTTDLGRLISDWMELRAWFESTNKARRSRRAAAPDEVAAVEHFERFERWLAFLLKGFYAVRRDLDAILEDATPATLPELLPLLVADQHRRHFFDRLAQGADPAWLMPLQRAGFFAHPPPPIAKEDDPNVVVHASWPASSYLAKMAEHPAAQEDVAAIVFQILSEHKIRNWPVQQDLVDVALKLPPPSAARLSRKMHSWGRGFTDSVARKLGTLSVQLARGEQTKDAVALMQALLATRKPQPTSSEEWRPEPEPRVGRWGLTTIIEKILPGFIDATDLDGFSLVVRALGKALRAAQNISDENDDHSHIWRPRIEDTNVEGSSARDLLTAAVARSASQLAQRAELRPGLIEIVDQQPWRVFRRVAQHLLGRFPSVTSEALKKHLLWRTEFDSFHREYRMLLETAFLHLHAGDQQTILNWIDTGPDPERTRQNLAFWSGRELTAEELERELQWWRWMRLGPLTSHLPPEWRHRQHELNMTFGQPPPVDAPDFQTSSAVGVRASALAHDDARSLSVRQIAERLRTWQPDATRGPVFPDDGQSVADAVAAEPDRFATDALYFRGLKPAYVRALFSGLERAIRQGRQFDWSPVIELASWALEQDPAVHQDDPWREETTWEWTRGAIARLIQAGLARLDAAPSAFVREKVWGLIEAFQDDPPGNRAEAVSAALQYALWLKGNAELFEATPEVVRFLDKLLDDTGPAAHKVHAELGEWLSWLAWHGPRWTQANLHRILPAAQDLWDAAWEAHLRLQVPPRRVFTLLRSAYVRAVEQIRPGESDVLPGVKAESSYIQERLADHVIVLYGRGDLEEAGAATILKTFFERADPALRRYALFAIGHSLQHDDDASSGPEPPIQPAVLERFRRLWVDRLSHLRNEPSIRQELPAFGAWFASERFDDTWAFDQLERVLEETRLAHGEPILNQLAVIRRLSSLSSAHPVRVAQILERLVELADDGSWAYGWLDEVRQIIGVAIRSGDPEARRAVIDLLDRLGSLGFRDIGQIVGASYDLADPLAIPYFLWDQPMTVAQFRERLSSASESERDRLLGLLLREAKDVDVWRFVSPEEVLARWSRIEKHLGRRRAFWDLLLKKWQEQGLLAH
jgi:hypothetical protein